VNEAFRAKGDILIRSEDRTASVPVQVYYSVTELPNVCVCVFVC